jgi:hypothetical protein
MKIIIFPKDQHVVSRTRNALSRARRRVTREPEYASIVVAGVLMMPAGWALIAAGHLFVGFVLVAASLMTPLLAIHTRRRCYERRLLRSCTTIVEGMIGDYARRGTADIETWMRQTH